MWIPLFTVALAVVATSDVFGTIVESGAGNHTFSSFSITDIGRGSVNSSDPLRVQIHPSSDSTSSPAARAKRQQPSTTDPSARDSPADNSDSDPRNQPSNREPGRGGPAQRAPLDRRHQGQPLRQNPQGESRYPQPPPPPPQSGRFVAAQRPVTSGRLPDEARSNVVSSGNRETRYPGPSASDVYSPPSRGLPRADPYLVPQYSSAGRNVALEIELLRFSNERGVLANGQSCGEGCTYAIAASLQGGDTRSRGPTQKVNIMTTMPKTVPESVDLLMKSRVVFCGIAGALTPATLRLDVKTGQRPLNSGRSARQAREPAAEDKAETTSGDPSDTTAEAYNPDVDDARNRAQQAPDQYSRDRYGGGNGDQQEPQLGRGDPEDRGYAASPQQPRQPASDRRGPAGPGQLVNSFDCAIDLANAGTGSRQAHTAEWRTLSCRPDSPNSQMELMFRYSVHSIDEADCARSRSDGPLVWSPLGVGK